MTWRADFESKGRGLLTARPSLRKPQGFESAARRNRLLHGVTESAGHFLTEGHAAIFPSSARCAK